MKTVNDSFPHFKSFSFYFIPGPSPAHGNRLVRRQSSNSLQVIPAGPHHMPVGRNLFFTCKAQVQNPGLVSDLKWFGPNGDTVPEEDR